MADRIDKGDMVVANDASFTHRSLLWLAAGLVAIAIFVFFSFKQFSDMCFATTRRINEQRLAEFSVQNVASLKMEFDNALGNVKDAATFFSIADIPDPDTTLELLSRLKQNSGFNRLWLATPDGRGLQADGSMLELTGRKLFAASMTGRVGIIKVDESLYDNQPVFGAFAPIIRDEAVIGAVIGIYEMSSLAITADNVQFGGEGFCNLFDENGTIILRAQNRHNLLAENQNLWSFFKTVTFFQGGTLENIRKNIKDGEKGNVFYRKDGNQRLGSYAPLGINDWYLISMATEDVLERNTKSINALAIGLLVKIVPCFLLLCAGIIYYFAHTRRRLLDINRRLDLSIQRFRVAASHLSSEIVEYDIVKDKMYRFDNASIDTPPDDGAGAPIEDLAAGLVNGCRITPESMADLERAIEKLFLGEKYSACVLQARRDGSDDETCEWYSVVFTSIAGANGRPERAIGTVEDVTNQKITEKQIAHDLMHRQAITSNVLRTYVSNITKERYLYGYDDANYSRKSKNPDYNKELELLVEDGVHPDDREMMLRELAAPELRRKFAEGINKVELEFRPSPTKETSHQWLRCTASLVQDFVSNDLYCYTYMEDITEAKLTQMELRHEAESDSLTGLYNRKTLDRKIEEFLASDEVDTLEKPSAFLIIDIDHFKNINDTYGHAAGDEVLVKLAAGLKGSVRAGDIVGRLGGDEFVLLVKNLRDVNGIRGKAELVNLAFHSLKLAEFPELAITGTIGICLIPEHGRELDQIYRNADTALYAAKEAGKDRFVIYDPSMDAGKTVIKALSESSAQIKTS